MCRRGRREGEGGDERDEGVLGLFWMNRWVGMRCGEAREEINGEKGKGWRVEIHGGFVQWIILPNKEFMEQS